MAVAGIIYLVLPGVTAPDPLGAMLMVVATTLPFRPTLYLGALEGEHSPLLGFLVDGAPIFGPWDGKVPDDLDECGGHTDAEHPFYHYHVQTKYPTQQTV